LSIETLRADARLVYVPIEYRGERSRMCYKRGPQLRREILSRVLGPRFPGFSGANAEAVDRHLSLLVACHTGRHGRALQLALSAYAGIASAHASLAALALKKRAYPAERAKLVEDAERCTAVLVAALHWYDLAAAVRGVATLNAIPVVAACYDKPLTAEVPVPQQHTGPVPPVTLDAQQALLSAFRASLGTVREHVGRLPAKVASASLAALGLGHEVADHISIGQLRLLEQAEVVISQKIISAVAPTTAG